MSNDRKHSCLLSMKYLLFNRDPYHGFLKFPTYLGTFHALHNAGVTRGPFFIAN